MGGDGKQIQGIKLFYLIGLETSALVAALRQRNIRTTEFILNLGDEDLNQQDSEGKTALMVAAGAYNLNLNFSEIDFENSTPHDLVANKWTNKEGARLLLKKGADVNLQDNEGRTALMFAAAWGGKGSIVQELLEHGAAINLQDNAGNTAVDYAVEYWLRNNPLRKKNLSFHNLNLDNRSKLKAWFRLWENEGVIQLLLHNNASVNLSSNESFPTPLTKMLHVEALLNISFDYNTPDSKLRIIEQLISNDTIHISNNDGIDALSIAAYYSSVDIFKIVLKHSYNLNHQDRRGETALMHLVSKRRVEVNTIEKLKLLLARKPDLNLKQRYGKTALMLALRGATSTLGIQLLLDNGASVNERNDIGQTALWYAKDGDKVRLLVEHKIDVDAQDSDGDTALMTAVRSKDSQKVKALLKYGANVGLKNFLNENAVQSAIYQGDLNMLRDLLEQDKGIKSDEELQDIMNSRISNYNVFNDTAEMLNILFEFRDVNIDTRNEFGQTLLIRAAQASDTDISLLKVILGMKPNLDLKDNDGKTALMHLAPRYLRDDKASMIKMLIEHGASTTITNDQGNTAREIAESSNWHCNGDCEKELDVLFG